MPHAHPRRSLESLKKEAKRWLEALRTTPPDADARARFERTASNAPLTPTLRDVQHALARELGFTGWTALKASTELETARDREAAQRTLAHYDAAADSLLEAYRTGTREAMERHYSYTWHRRAWRGMRRYVLGDLGLRSGPDGAEPDITLDDARWLVAREHGFAGWDDLTMQARLTRAAARMSPKPVGLQPPGADDEAMPLLRTRDWDELLEALAERPAATLRANGQMTDGVLADVVRIAGVETLDLSGSRAVTDEGVLALAGLTTLASLDLSGTSVTDRGLSVLRSLPALRVLSLSGTRVTDAGMPELAHCPALERVHLHGTTTGDAAIRALADKRQLRWFASGERVSDEGLAMLHDLPAFTSWQGGEVRMALLSADCEPNKLTLRGSFGDAGLRRLRGLDGLFGLDIHDSRLPVTAAGVDALIDLPNLAWLAIDAKEDWMAAIARLPALRFLLAQDTTAGDDGFAALSASRTIEYIWGRESSNLGARGFLALAGMPRLRALSVGLGNVGDAALASLREFPALRELMPMGVPDDGYRHIGQCEDLESLILMYCRHTTDAATEHIAGMRQLSYYYNSYTAVTDRTPQILSGVDSLERITFSACHGLTNAGLAALATLPRLRELRASGRKVTDKVAAAFGSQVDVHVG
jgi:hypothetical protein